MHRFSRYHEKLYGLFFSAFALFMGIHVARSMFPLDLGNTPMAAKIFIVLFIFCWYGGLLVFTLFGLRWVHTIEIDNIEIRVCLGRLVLRRIPLEQIKTVGLSALYSRSSIIFLELVLSSYDLDELAERGQKYLNKRSVRKWMSEAGISLQDPHAAAKACLFESRKAVVLKMERTMEAESILRLHLHSAVFLTETV